MLTCKEASHLVSKKLDGKLTSHERLGLWLHLAMCSLCRRYARDIKKMHQTLSKAGNNQQAILPESVKLAEHSRKRIKHALKEAVNHLR